MGLLLAYTRIILIIFWLLSQSIVVAIFYAICFGRIDWYRYIFWKVFGFLIGIKIKKTGRLTKDRPLMIAINHTSFFDIIALGYAFNPNFISKADVQHWPIFGFLAKCGGTLFISRSRSSIGKEATELSKRILNQKKPIIFAPEGTTNDGIELLPFKPAMFEIMLEHKGKLNLQPMIIKYTHINNKPTTDEQKQLISWTVNDNSSVMQKMLKVLRNRSITLTVKVLDQIDTTKFNDRKELCKYTEDIMKAEYKKI